MKVNFAIFQDACILANVAMLEFRLEVILIGNGCRNVDALIVFTSNIISSKVSLIVVNQLFVQYQRAFKSNVCSSVY